jgi:hypothetical protein
MPHAVQSTQAARRMTCIWEVTGSNLGPDSKNPHNLAVFVSIFSQILSLVDMALT